MNLVDVKKMKGCLHNQVKFIESIPEEDGTYRIKIKCLLCKGTIRFEGCYPIAHRMDCESAEGIEVIEL
jgi:hypothetical protein